MSKWNKMKLGDIASIASSKRIFAREYQREGIPFYRGKEIIEKHKGNAVSTELFISRERYEEIKNKYDVPRPGDILLSSVGTLGIPWLVDEDEFYFKDGNLTWLRCNDKTTPEFLYLWLNSAEAKNQIDAKCIGSTQKALTIETLNKFEVTLPPMDAQVKICDTIIPISKKIDINRKINNNLEQQISALYQSWFETFDLTDGVCPEIWSNQELSTIAEISSGKRPPIKAESCSKETPIPIVGAASVMGFTSKSNHTDKILVTGRVGTHGIVQRFNTPCWTSDNTLVIKSTYYEFTNQILQRIDYSAMNRGSTQPLITQGDIKKVSVLVPDTETLSKFETFAGTMMNQWEANKQENVELASLRDTLLPKLMSGELDVSDIDL